MNQVREIRKQYQEQIGQADSYISFLHGVPAAEAARKLQAIEEPQYISHTDYLFVWRVGQVTGNAGFHASVAHQARDVYMFSPARI